MGSKKDIRDTIRKQRLSLTSDQVSCFSESIIKHVIGFKPFLLAQTVAIYLPVGNEVDTSSLISHLDSLNKTICLPVVLPEHRLGFCRFRTGDSLQPGSFGILEPQIREWLDIKDIDLFFMPLVGFDANGARLGYGGGYYDRALSVLSGNKLKPVLVGLAFNFQEVALLPYAAHDVPLHYIVTENGIRCFV
ncbi:MAG: 5-formyltetrahydrofolate cyclo-ligase [Magnetococcales bacterium]|nr:5-formyltetrahydrofolate cyclo-ligase [Magnetococcales bacterium]